MQQKEPTRLDTALQVAQVLIPGVQAAASGASAIGQLYLQNSSLNQTERREQLQRILIAFESLKRRIDSFVNEGHLAEIPTLCDEAINLFMEGLEQAELQSDEKLKICELRRIAAFAYFRNQQFDQAKKQCEETLKLNAEDSGALILMGKLELMLGSIENASKYFKSAFKQTKGSPERQLIVQYYQAFIGYNVDLLINHGKVCEQRKLVLADEALLAMQGWAYFTSNQFSAAAVTFKKVIDIIASNPLAAISRAIEVHLLKQFIAISLAFCLLSSDVQFSLLEESLTNVISLWRVYREKIKTQEINHSLTFCNSASNRYSCFITFCLFDRMVESLMSLESSPKAAINCSEDDTFLTELFAARKISQTSQDESNQKEKEKINKPLLELYFSFLKESFEQDPYEPTNLFLLSGLQEIGQIVTITHYAKLANAHLAYCYLHGYRITQNLIKATSLLKNSDCDRGIAEYEFYKFQKLIKDDKEFNKEALQRIASTSSRSITVECNGNLRAKIYYALVLLRSDNQEERVALKMLNDTAIKGIKYAQAWLANIYAFGLYGVGKDSKLAGYWIETAVANISLNEPDYFFACIVQSRMYRTGESYNKDENKSNEILLSICQMGSVAGMLELANSHWIAYKNWGSSSSPNIDFDSDTEADREAAVYWWEQARKLEFDSELLPQELQLKYLLTLNYALTVLYGQYTKRQELQLKYSLTLNYALATLYGQYTKSMEYSLSQALLLECHKLAEECQGIDLKHLYYYLGIVSEFLCERESNYQKAKDYFQHAYVVNNNERVSVRAFSRLSFINSKNSEATSSSSQQAVMTLPRDRVIWPSVSANSDDIGLIFKDPCTSQIKVQMGKIKKNSEIHRSSLIIVSPFQNNCIRPRIAINSKIVVVSSCTNERLFYKVGTQQAESFSWGTTDATHRGISPVIALNNQNIIVEVHRSEVFSTLHYRVGQVDLRNLSIQWGLSNKLRQSGNLPAIAMWDNTIIVAWEADGGGIQYQLGTLSNDLNVQWTNNVQRLNGQYTNPCLVMMQDKIILLAEGLGNDDGLYYLCGKLNGQTITWENNNEFEYYAVGYSPTAILHDNVVFAFHESDCGGEKPKLCRHDIALNNTLDSNMQAGPSGT